MKLRSIICAAAVVFPLAAQASESYLDGAALASRCAKANIDCESATTTRESHAAYMVATAMIRKGPLAPFYIIMAKQDAIVLGTSIKGICSSMGMSDTTKCANLDAILEKDLK